jgi:hypothetical protein
VRGETALGLPVVRETSLDKERRIRRWEERLRGNGSLSLDPDQVDRASAAGYVFFATF